MEAKARGARVIHIDPHFTRTSALADTFVPIRVGSDIAFLGGVIRYILENGKDFREYVTAYTNASSLVSPDYRDTEDLDGLFSGFDPETARLRHRSWQYRVSGPPHRRDVRCTPAGAGGTRSGAGGRRSRASRGGQPTRHCSTPTASTRSCSGTSPATRRSSSRRSAGCRRRSSARSCDAWTANSGRERTTTLIYSVGWTQHSVGAQYIRAGSIVQLLLGNIGRPGGGILALRGHASIQG